jgi:hypothetical protein
MLSVFTPSEPSRVPIGDSMGGIIFLTSADKSVIRCQIIGFSNYSSASVYF